jgi:hypothetical protein
MTICRLPVGMHQVTGVLGTIVADEDNILV